MSPRATPTVAVVVPCFDEAGYVDPMLDALLPQLARAEHWSLVLVDDSSTDATPAILAGAAQRCPRVQVLSGRYGAPGAARSAGVALALRAPQGAPDWVVTLDADVIPAGDWLGRWDTSIRAVHADDAVGALNGVEVQDHLFAGHPHAAQVSAAFGLALVAAERAVGVTNLNGVNHGIRTAAYLTAGPYVQPVAPGPHGTETLAGEDWDLGVRIRRAGFRVEETDAAVVDRGRRLLADVHAYVSGDAYEGAFVRLAASSGSPDIDAADVATLVDHAVDRVLRHFLCKPILADAVAAGDVRGLSAATLDAMAAWMRRWPHPTFDESRNGFVFGRLARFGDAFLEQIRAELDLGLETVLARVR